MKDKLKQEGNNQIAHTNPRTRRIPPNKQPPFLKRLNEIVSQRNDAEMARVFDHAQTAYPNLRDVYCSLRCGKSGSFEITGFITTMRTLLVQLSGQEDFSNKRANAGQIRNHFADIFSCPYEFDRKVWAVSKNATELALSDEQNIETTSCKQKIIGDGELNLIRYMISDLLEMIGQLARRINSCEMTRILRTLVAVKGKPWYGENLSPEAAAKLADEIVYCYEAIRCEIRLLSPAERSALVYPKKPRLRPDIVIDTNPPSDLSPEEKTKFCRNVAYRRLEHDNLFLMPLGGFYCEYLDPVVLTEKSAKAIAESYKNKKPTLDKGEDRFDYKSLAKILSADLRLYYDRYFMDQDFDEGEERYIEYENKDDVIEDTPQQKAKDRIVAYIREILDSAIKLSAESGSTASEDWVSAQVAFEKRDGDFHSRSAEDDDAAEADLDEFLTAFRRGRQRLWADWQRHCRKDVSEKPIPTEPKGKAIEDIKESVRSIDVNTAQAALNTTPKSEPRDRIITLVRRVNVEMFDGKSIPKAVEYVRLGKDIPDEYAQSVAEARQFAKTFVKGGSSRKKNEDSFWNAIKKEAQPSAAKSAAKRKSKKNADPSAPPGPVPILDRGIS